MSDQAIPTNQDPTRRLPEVDAGDPLLEAFAYQHDLRERFLQALKDAKAEMERFEGIAVDDVTMRSSYAAVRSIIVDAIDPVKIEEWNRLGRPLPSLEGPVAERGRAVDSFITDITARNEGGGRLWTIWSYDPQFDHWAPADPDYAASEDEAKAEALKLGESAPIGVEYEAIPVGAFPRPGDDD